MKKIKLWFFVMKHILKGWVLGKNLDDIRKNIDQDTLHRVRRTLNIARNIRMEINNDQR